jgi:hypothetical protein
MADGEGFEPSRRLRVCRFSRPVPSTTRPPILKGLSGQPFANCHRIATDAGASPFARRPGYLGDCFGCCRARALGRWPQKIEGKMLAPVWPILTAIGEHPSGIARGVRARAGVRVPTASIGFAIKFVALALLGVPVARRILVAERLIIVFGASSAVLMLGSATSITTAASAKTYFIPKIPTLLGTARLPVNRNSQDRKTAPGGSS